MSYCKYHPLVPATWCCEKCHTDSCDTCIDEGQRGDSQNCIICGAPLESLGSGHTVEPFWRRLQESFRYPLNKNSLTLIVAVSVITAILSAVPLFFIFTFIVYLALVGTMMKYCFSCLEHTAGGEMTAPDISVAYGGGLRVMLHLFGMILVMSLVVGVIGSVAGPGLAGFVGVIILAGFPAILINYALTNSLLSALNLLTMLQLILTIGLPYGLLIAFIMIMAGSVGVIQGLIGDSFSLVSAILQSIVSYYYMVVVFHLMGYMIFQYQGRLGFVARRSDLPETVIRSPQARALAMIDVFLKEGRPDKAVDLFDEGVKSFAGDLAFYERYFEFIYRTRSAHLLKGFAEKYLALLAQSGKQDRLAPVYKQIVQLQPGFKPADPALRVKLAMACKQKGDPTSAIKLLKNLHKEFPDYSGMVAAYEVMADAFDDLPNMKTQAEKCRALVKHFRARMPEQQPESQQRVRKKASFTVSDFIRNSGMAKESEQTGDVEPAESNDLPPIEFK